MSPPTTLRPPADPRPTIQLMLDFVEELRHENPAPQRFSVGAAVQTAVVADRPEVPQQLIRRLGRILEAFPDCEPQDAWVGVCWRVRQATVAHVFGGEDGRFRLTFRAEPEEVAAFEHLGPPYFRADWGSNVVGLLLDEHTDWQEVAELLADSYCIQAPAKLAARVGRPG